MSTEAPDSATGDDDAFEAVFLQRRLADRAAGRDPGISEYLGLFPGREDTVRRLWDAFGPGTTWAEAAFDGRPEEAPGHRLGPYVLDRILGRGGQGEVWLAEDTRLGRKVALKLLKLAGASGEALARFRREAGIASRLDHPGICAVYETGVEQGLPYIAMRHVEGETLAARLRYGAWHATAVSPGRAGSDRPGASPAPSGRGAHLPWLRLLEKAARAVHAAHEAGVLHRDLKPGNIMVTPEDEPVILDFGLARMTEGDDALRTRTGEVFGTPAYLAPEQIRTPPEPADRRTDVWALGVALFEAVAGRRPFEAPTREGLYRAILETEPDPRGAATPVAADLRLVLLTALEKDRGRRYQTALALAEDLRRVQAAEPILARPIGTWLRLRRWARRDPMRAALVALLLVLAAAGGWAGARFPAWRADLDLGAARRREDAIEERLAAAFARIRDPRNAGAARAEFAALRTEEPELREAWAGEVIADFIARPDGDAVARLDEVPPGRLDEEVLLALRRLALDRSGRIEEARALAPPDARPRSSLACYIAAIPLVNRGVEGDVPVARRALGLLRRCVDGAPRPRLLYQLELCRAARAAEDPEATLQAVDALESRFPPSPPVWFGVADNLYQIDPPRAVAAARRWAVAAPDDPRARCVLTQTLVAAGDPEAAAMAAREAIALDPESPDARYVLGVALRNGGRAEEAREAFAAAVDRQPDHWSALYNLASVLLDLDRTDEAADRLRQALALRPLSAPAWQVLANCEADRNDWAAAEAAARKAVGIDPGFAQARNTLAIALAQLGRRDEGIVHLREAVRVDPAYPRGHHNLGRLLLDAGRPGEALGFLRRAAELARKDPSWTLPTSELIARSEELLPKEIALAAIRQGRAAPGDGEEAAGLADLAGRRGEWALSAWCWAESLRLLDIDASDGGRRVRAALAAARAADPESDPAPDPEARARWRLRSLEWLESETAAIEARVESGRANPGTAARRGEALLSEPALRPFHDESRLVALPDAESSRWRRLWSSLRALASDR